MRAPTPLLPILLVSAVVGGGCGQADDRRQVRTVASDFSTSLSDGDGATACAQLSQPTVDELESQERAPCEEAILELDLSPAPVEHVRVYVTSAQVELGGGELAFLDRVRDGWRLTAIGCRFEDGKPRDRPATCEVQA